MPKSAHMSIETQSHSVGPTGCNADNANTMSVPSLQIPMEHQVVHINQLGIESVISDRLMDDTEDEEKELQHLGEKAIDDG